MYKVIKEFAGVQIGSEIEVHPKYVNHMIEQGYIEEINEPENKAIVPEYKQNVTLTIEGKKLKSVLDKQRWRKRNAN